MDTGLCSISRSKWWESETWYFQLLLYSPLGLHKNLEVRFLVAVLMSFLWILVSVLLHFQIGGKVRLGTPVIVVFILRALVKDTKVCLFWQLSNLFTTIV